MRVKNTPSTVFLSIIFLVEKPNHKSTDTLYCPNVVRARDFPMPKNRKKLISSSIPREFRKKRKKDRYKIEKSCFVGSCPSDEHIVVSNFFERTLKHFSFETSTLIKHESQCSLLLELEILITLIFRSNGMEEIRVSNFSIPTRRNLFFLASEQEELLRIKTYVLLLETWT